jgi:hypothetical protein
LDGGPTSNPAACLLWVKSRHLQRRPRPRRRPDSRSVDQCRRRTARSQSWCAVDCGVGINPDVIRAQIEGGIGFGLGHILFSEVPLVDGRPVPKNFDDYRSLRINEMPQIEVTILNSREHPTGVGDHCS